MGCIRDLRNHPVIVLVVLSGRALIVRAEVTLARTLKPICLQHLRHCTLEMGHWLGVFGH